MKKPGNKYVSKYTEWSPIKIIRNFKDTDTITELSIGLHMGYATAYHTVQYLSKIGIIKINIRDKSRPRYELTPKGIKVKEAIIDYHKNIISMLQTE